MKRSNSISHLRDVYKYIYVWFKQSFWSFGESVWIKLKKGDLAERRKETSKKKREALGKKKKHKPYG